MLDPFPIPVPPLLSVLTERAGNFIGLESLHLHIHEILLSALFYHSICLYISPWLSTVLFPKIYPSLPWKTKLNWDVHVVSLVQSTTINILALYVIFHDQERAAMDWKQRVWGYTGATGLVQAFATGYFAWDLWVSVVHVDIFGIGLLAHAVSALCVFSLGYRPFVNYYAPIFILYELSSPFLNFHWFFDKVGMTGSSAQLYNGIALITTFFCSRLVYGIYQSYHVLHDIFHAIQYQKTPAGIAWLEEMGHKAGAAAFSAVGKEETAEVWTFAAVKAVPMSLAVIYLASNVVLTSLNIYWFGKMIETVRKRFPAPLGTMRPEPKKEIAMACGLHEDGHKAVEADATEIKPKKARRRI